MNEFSFSFLLPTRGRPELAQRFLQSIVETTSCLEAIEVVLAVDDDDLPSQQITHERLKLKKVVLPRGATMGSLNRACFEASSGRYIMLINDDVVIRTKDWDKIIAAAWARYEDDIALLHVNDLLFREKLCTFPMLSRRACLAIGVCPAEYRRYRIDDHIYDTYNMLAHLGHKRIIYLEEVVFEHENYEEGLAGQEKQETAHLFEATDKKVYLPNQAIIQEDAHFFETRLDQRKQDALKLAGLIEQQRVEQQQATYQRLLRGIKDAYSYRRSDFVIKAAAARGSSSASATTTVAVVTSDIYKPHAQKCLAALKRHTANFDLLILDNNNGPNFNHPREMNKVLQTVKTDFLVLMDDDVFVEAGWLEGLLQAVDADTGVVTPLHKDKHGHLSYSGVYLKGDNLGTHAHTLDIPTEPRATQCMCSAIVLIDLKKCGHFLFNSAYRKYFLDLDYSLQVWEAGYKVVCTPQAMVTHMGGGTMAYYTHQSQQLYSQDAATFMDIWIKSGRLAAIEQKVWSNFAYLRLLSDLPQKISQTLAAAEQWPLEQFKQAVDELLGLTQPYVLFQQSIVARLQNCAARFRSRGDIAKAEYSETLVKQLTWEPFHVRLRRRAPKKALAITIKLIKANRQTRRLALAVRNKAKPAFERYQRLPRPIRHIADKPVFKLKSIYEKAMTEQTPIELSLQNINPSTPTLLGMYGNYNLVAYEGLIYGLPKALGHVNLTYEEDRCRPGIVTAETLEEIKQAIDQNVLLTPNLLGSYKNYNLVAYQGRAYGVPLSLGTIDLNREETRNRPEIISAEHLNELKPIIDQTNHINSIVLLVRISAHHLLRGRVRPIARYVRDLLRAHKQFAEAEQQRIPPQPELVVEPVSEVENTGGDFKYLIYQALSQNGNHTSNSEVALEVAEADYKGFNIFQLESRYFALPQEEGVLDVERMRRHQYSWLTVGHTLPEVKREIDQAYPAGFTAGATQPIKTVKERALFICNVAPQNMPTYLNRLRDYDLTLLAPAGHYQQWSSDYMIFKYLNTTGAEAKTIDLAQTSPSLLQTLKAQNFDLVIIPYEGRKFWDDVRLEQFAAALTNRLIAVFPNGQTRLYKGEDIHRIFYNKAYLNSMFKFVPPLKSKRLLEVGCSDGLACDLLLSEDPEGIVGIDMMDAVGCNYLDPRIIYAKMDASKLLFADQTFDLCYSIATMEHVQDPLIVLQEMKRVTKKGGYCYVQAGPLYHSPFGHHMFGYFDHYPWIHLRLSKEEIIAYAQQQQIDQQVEGTLGRSIEDYVNGMLNPHHINGKFFREYSLTEFIKSSNIEVLNFSRSYEGENLLTEDILGELSHISKEDLIAHGFELIFRVK